jgi:hypothetical protein
MKLLRNAKAQSAKLVIICGFTGLIAATSVFGQIISFDEWGNSTGIPHGFIGADPSGGVTNSVLMYALPFGVVPGDLLLTDAAGTSQFSDVIRFWNPTGSANQSLIIFYSDLPESGEIAPPADVGLPSQLLPSVVGPFLEIGTEAFNYYDYTAATGVGGILITYHIVSDGVIPEPSTCSLVILGGGLLIGLKRHFQSGRK